MDALALLSDEDDDDEIFSDEEGPEGGAGSTEANFAVYVLVANQKNPDFFRCFVAFW